MLSKMHLHQCADLVNLLQLIAPWVLIPVSVTFFAISPLGIIRLLTPSPNQALKDYC